MKEVQRRTRTPTSRDDLDLIASDPQARMSGLQASRGGPEEGTRSMPVPVPAGRPQAGPMGSPMPVPTQAPRGSPPVPTQAPMAGMGGPIKQTLNELLTMVPPPVPDENGKLEVEDSAGTIALINLIKKGSVVNDMVAQTRGIEDSTIEAYMGGGLMQLAAGGEFRGSVPGDGHGMEDNIYMPIREGSEEVGTLAVSPSEYVVDSYTMAALGNGNADEGAEVMDEVVEGVRERAYGNRQQPNEINGLAALRPMLERV